MKAGAPHLDFEMWDSEALTAVPYVHEGDMGIAAKPRPSCPHPSWFYHGGESNSPLKGHSERSFAKQNPVESLP